MGVIPKTHHALKLGIYQEEFEDTNGIDRICKSKKNRQHNGQKKKDKQRPIKHYTENNRSSRMNPTKIRW
jgi:hypothetical protein